MLAHVSKCEARAIIVVPKTRAAWFPMMEGTGVRSVQTKIPGREQPVLLGYTTNAEQNRRDGLRVVILLIQGNHAPRRDIQHPSTNKQTHIRTRRPITSGPSHRRISTHDAYTHKATSTRIATSHRRISTRGAHHRRISTRYTHKATSTRIATSHRRISTRGAHRLTVHDNNTYARPAGSH